MQEKRSGFKTLLSCALSPLRPLRLGVSFFLLFTLACSDPAPRPEVILYTSSDDYLLREVIAPFEKETGITVRIVGDTEATKTTGLVQRIIAERAHPRADVWWSNEPFGTIRLAEEGLLTPFKPKALEDFGGTWPPGYTAPDGTWYGFALRARVIVYNTARVRPEVAPQHLQQLTEPKWKGRIGMARPQFGTTRGHMAAIVAQRRDGVFRAWLTQLKDNGLRLYDGNSAVVRAVAQGEIDAGLTDSDDVLVGQREKWPVAMIFEQPARINTDMYLCSIGAVPIPNTVAIVKGAPHPDAAARLANYLLSERVERVLAQSESLNLPLRPALARELIASLPFSSPPAPNLHAIHGAIPAAMKACTDILGD